MLSKLINHEKNKVDHRCKYTNVFYNYSKIKPKKIPKTNLGIFYSNYISDLVY